MNGGTSEPVGTGASVGLLDPLRALAAWAVVAWHLADWVGFRMPLFTSAAFAVDVFMNISGFLMLYHFYRREAVEPWEQSSTWKIFYLRRWFRIAPLYYLLLLIVLLVPTFGQAYDWQYVLLRFTFLFGFVPDHAAANPMPDWSLSLEMQFYVAFPFLALLTRRIGFGAFFFACSLVAAVTWRLMTYYEISPAGPLGNFPQPSVLPMKLHIFAVGMVAAGVLLQGVNVLRSPWFVPGWACFAIASPFNYTRLLAVVYLGLYLVFVSGVGTTFVSSVLGKINSWCERCPIFQIPADTSYSAYLLHNLLFVALLAPWLGDKRITDPIQFSLLLVAVLVVINLIGWVLFRFVERPAIRFGKRFARAQ